VAKRSITFDHIADRYDATRGGEIRAAIVADAVAPWVEPPVLEIGVGTGAIAAALQRHGPAVLGLDLSMPMLRRAAARIPGGVAQADAMHLPARPRSLGTVVAVNVLHLVAGADQVVHEAAEALRPSGRLVVTGMEGDRYVDNDVGASFDDLDVRMRPFPSPTPASLSSAHPDLQLVHEGFTAPLRTERSPNQAADELASRTWSWCWDLTDEVWAAEVEPVIDALHRLPDPERPRPHVIRRRFVVLERDPRVPA
jgi:SAM-dependent methyltransferase